MFNLQQNGFIVKRIDSDYSKHFKNYFGIEGDIWPISKYDIDIIGIDEFNYLYSYFESNIENSNTDNSYVDVCSDQEYLKRYISACEKLEFEIEVLFCETEKNYPKFDIKNSRILKNLKLIGYDYGYPGADYYSCVYNDVTRIPEMLHLNLNEYGLFNNEKEIEEFISLRNELEKLKPKMTFELGQFIVYKLWKCDKNIL